MKGTEATISWDVSGYYMYLPALFIYKDIKKCSFKDDILSKYQPTPDFQQAFVHQHSGNYVMKYSIGQAIQFSPFLFLAHIWASVSDKYPADGFSFPYQFMISFFSLLIAILGLYYLRKTLLFYFSDGIVSLTLILLVLGSNYLNYAAIDGAMTHNSLFTLYVLIIYTTILFYKKPDYKKALAIGTFIGLAALTRPTEIISCLIPILWGFNFPMGKALKSKFNFIKEHFLKFVTAAIICLTIGFIQLAYWKYASGEWIVYSYQEYGFSWLRPHLIAGFFSYKSGWLTYTPLMLFSLLGFVFFIRLKKSLFLTFFIFSGLFIYICFAWDVWWYGGSLGQRAMVQAYPVLVFPLAALLTWLK